MMTNHTDAVQYVRVDTQCSQLFQNKHGIYPPTHPLTFFHGHAGKAEHSQHSIHKLQNAMICTTHSYLIDISSQFMVVGILLTYLYSCFLRGAST